MRGPGERGARAPGGRGQAGPRAAGGGRPSPLRIPRRPLRVLGLALGLLVAAPDLAGAQIGSCTPDFASPVRLDLETTLGTIPLELYPGTAPNTVANFEGYVGRGDYDLTLVHRSVPGFVIQGGGFRSNGGVYEAVPTLPDIDNEACLLNTRGTIAMARLDGDPDSATSQWFINLADNPDLDIRDGGFTAFGRVVGNGMQVADAIAALPVFDALTILELPFNQLFRALPLLSVPVDPPGGYGCYRGTPTFGLASETQDLFIADPLRHSSTVVVPLLFDPQCDGSAAGGPPSVPCDPASGRDVFDIDLLAQTTNLVRTPMSCDALAESEDSLVALRAGTIAQLHAQRVEVLSVPEPASGPSASVALGMLAAGVLARAGAPRRASRAGQRTS